MWRWSAACLHRVHLVQWSAAALAILLTSAKMNKIPSLLSAFLLCLRCVVPEYGSFSRFKGVLARFGVVVWVCVVLVVCVACVAFVRVWS